VAVFSGHPQLEESGRPEAGRLQQPDAQQSEPGVAREGERMWTFRVKPGEDLRLEDLRYGSIAKDSYAVFLRLRDEGVIERDVRFQVALPAPNSAINAFFDDPSQWPQVLRDGKPVGVSSGTVYSLYYREVISHGTVDLDAAEIGTEVVVQHGNFGGPINDVRATVARYPYLDLERNQSYDLSAVPSGIAGS
jgi:glycine cleavage system aminomethyltransferase T